MTLAELYNSWRYAILRVPMAKLVPENHPTLHAMAENITPEEFKNGTVTKIIKDLRQAIKTYKVDGFTAVAIAAPQIGIGKRVFIIEDQSDEADRLPTIIAANPRFLKLSKKSRVAGEGCLSIPDKYGLVRRSTNVTIEAYDETGQKFSRGAGGLLAQIMQHEYDHLDGILFTDRAEKVWTKEELDQSRKENPTLP